MQNAAVTTTGSVYTFVDIPDYRRATFALTDIDVFAPSGTPAMKDSLADLLLAPPTARREFDRRERATAFVRFYEGPDGPPVTVFLTTRIVDDRNRKRYGQDASIASSEFSRTHTAHYLVELPLSDLESGAYLLTIRLDTFRLDKPSE